MDSTSFIAKFDDDPNPTFQATSISDSDANNSGPDSPICQSGLDLMNSPSASIAPSPKMITSFVEWYKDTTHYKDGVRILPQLIYVQFYKHDLWTAYENDKKTDEINKFENPKLLINKFSEFKRAVLTIDLELQRLDSQNIATGDNENYKKIAFPTYPDLMSPDATEFDSFYEDLVKDVLINLKSREDKDPDNDKVPTTAELRKWNPNNSGKPGAPKGKKKNTAANKRKSPSKKANNQSSKRAKSQRSSPAQQVIGNTSALNTEQSNSQSFNDTWL